jgi:hypothetical protein
MTAAAAGFAAAAALLAVSACSSSEAAPESPHRQVGALKAGPAPQGWRHASLPDGGAVMAYPPDMHPVESDKGEVSVADLSAKGTYLLYLNATPRQGRETLSDWPDFRVEHLTDDDASSARLIAESHGVHFFGGTGTCVIDSYITKAKSHHFTELACYVRGATSSSVVIAAAPTADWSKAAPVLKRAVAAYQVR